MAETLKDCWTCRLTSGLGLIAASAYMVYNSKHLKPISRYSVTALGSGLSLLGVLRLFGISPLKNQSQQKEKSAIQN